MIGFGNRSKSKGPSGHANSELIHSWYREDDLPESKSFQMRAHRRVDLRNSFPRAQPWIDTREVPGGTRARSNSFTRGLIAMYISETHLLFPLAAADVVVALWVKLELWQPTLTPWPPSRLLSLLPLLPSHAPLVLLLLLLLLTGSPSLH